MNTKYEPYERQLIERTKAIRCYFTPTMIDRLDRQAGIERDGGISGVLTRAAEAYLADKE